MSFHKRFVHKDSSADLQIPLRTYFSSMTWRHNRCMMKTTRCSAPRALPPASLQPFGFRSFCAKSARKTAFSSCLRTQQTASGLRQGLMSVRASTTLPRLFLAVFIILYCILHLFCMSRHSQRQKDTRGQTQKDRPRVFRMTPLPSKPAFRP